MQPHQIPFPTIVAPHPLGLPRLSSAATVPTGQAGRIVAPPPSAPAPVSLFSAGRRADPASTMVSGRVGTTVVGAGTVTVTQTGAPDRPGWTGAYLAACEAAFDRISNLGAHTPDWLTWRASHLRAGEGRDFADALAESGRLATTFVSAEARDRLDTHRSAGLYRIDGADGRRAVCLLFTTQGLAHVFIAGDALIGIRDPIIAELSARSRLIPFSLTREAARFSLSLSQPACGLYCRLFGERIFVQRQIWLDEAARVLVATKRAAVIDGLSGAIAGRGLLPEVSDGLPDSLVASTDLSRRAQMLRRMLMPGVLPQRPPTAATTPSAGTSRARSAAAPAPVVVSTPVPLGLSQQTVIQSFVP